MLPSKKFLTPKVSWISEEKQQLGLAFDLKVLRLTILIIMAVL